MVKNPPANTGDLRDMGSIPGFRRSPEGGHGNPTPVFLSGEYHGQMILEGYSPWGHRVRHDWRDLACGRAGGNKESPLEIIVIYRILN